MFIYYGRALKNGQVATLQEGVVNAALKKSTIHFRRHFNPLRNFTKVDFYVPSKKLCIYVDGNYWHSSLQTRAKDQRQVSVLKAAGYRVLRVSESTINKLGIDGVFSLLEKETRDLPLMVGKKPNIGG